MFLKSLEIFGFKSFVEPTTIEFEPGISAIVGPNGCGKSNILDAIRWALGEQSLKLLRCKKLDDLIFCGSKTHKPLGMAEISMTFATAGAPAQINIAGLPFELDEIKATRRVFRNGETECLINKVPCRLKDLQDLYIDLSINNGLFSLIEQGQIGSILDAKPAERRFLVEDASGILKYRMRKNLALKKLEATKINLQRAQDVLSEVQRQLQSLRRQAKKAEDYRKLKEEARRLELSILSIESSRVLSALEAATEDNSRLSQKEVELLARKSEAEAQEESLKLALTTCQGELSSARAELFESEKQVDKLSSLIKTNGERLGTLKQELERIIQSRARLEAEAADDERSISSRRDELAQLRLENEAAANEHRSLNSMVQKMRATLSDLEKKFDSEKSSMIDLLSSISQVNNAIGSLQAQKALIERRKAKLLAEAENERLKAEAAEDYLREKTQAAALIWTEAQALKPREKSIKEMMSGVAQALEKEKRELAEAQARLTFARSTLNSIEELQKQYFNYSKAMRDLIDNEGGRFGVEGVRGVIGRVVEAAPGFEAAIEAALGERFQGVVIDSEKGMIEAINYLRSASAGKGLLIPSRPRLRGNFQKGPLSGDGYLGRGCELVSCPEEFKDAINYLLADVIVVADFNSAMALWGEDDHGFTIVTLDGEVIYPGGAIWAGKPDGGSAGILAQKRKIQKLKAEICAAELLADSKTERCKKLNQEIEDLRKEQLRIDEHGQRCEKELARTLAEQKACEAELKRCRNQTEVCAVELEELNAELAGLDALGAEKRAELDALLNLKSDAERRTADFAERTALMRAELDDMIEAQNKAALLLASTQGKIETTELDLRRLAERKRSITNGVTEKNNEAARAEKLIAQLEASSEKAEKALIAAEQDRERMRAAVSALGEKTGEISENLKAAEHETKKLASELEALRDEIKRASIRVAELKVELEHKRQSALERGLELSALLKESPPMAGHLAELETSLERARSRLGALGDVNLQACEELQKLKERHDFLGSQYEDLTKSVNELQNTITRINNVTREMFLEAFNSINNNFMEVFRELFAGGSAELMLTDEADIWETGIDIMAQPPGKKLQNIMLLSTGEKAMTAAALLIAIFLTKPGPFCILDEVDAPLDEANVEKFCATIEKLSAKTQFILITHNKSTILRAKSIYGVTMEEDGVSKLISMKLESTSYLSPRPFHSVKLSPTV